MDIEIQSIDNIKGKGLFAKKDFHAGSVIFEEDPVVCCQFSWNAAYGYKACDHCLRPLETAEENARRLSAKPELHLPYPNLCHTDKSTITYCSLCGIHYCSTKCQTTAYNQYHRTLCFERKSDIDDHPLYQLNEMWKQMHYPPETSTIMIIPRILATIQQAVNPEEAQAQFLEFCHRTVNEDSKIAHKFLGEKFVDQISTLHNLLVKAMKPDGISHFLTQEGFQTLIALIGTNGQGVGTSAISEWVTKSLQQQLSPEETVKLDQFIDKLYEDMDSHSGSFLNNEGVALYCLQSACNHSCMPNAEATYLHNNSKLSLVALTDISAGDEICMSYLDECTLQRSRYSRNKELGENYLFTCTCPKCELQAHDPNVTSDEEEEDDEMDDMSE
ncbi:set and mynd domain-containing protein 5 [Holotrichia oblita]|uniref:Set and mynd domain-containing protein 5 n=1 Tax=Holotrichia oblita TaxID=644536 RepID=A0ACB9SUU1_HOLOL|nr:set and mynd domain-containing protein 5 [Holotrichia oblita]